MVLMRLQDWVDVEQEGRVEQEGMCEKKALKKRHGVEEQEGRVEKNVEGNVVQERINYIIFFNHLGIFIIFLAICSRFFLKL